MGLKKKNKVILIVIILMLILIIITGFAYTYFATDLFKSNKELFFKYVTQLGDKNSGFIDTKIGEYFEKRKNTPYTNDGTFAMEVTPENKTINDFNISFSGKTDNQASSMEQEISINYSSEVAFPINYRKIEETMGIQTKYISNKYVAVETDKLGNGTLSDLSAISDLTKQVEKIEKLTQMSFDEEKYIDIINTQLQDSQFEKVEENNSKGYKLTITEQQIKNIIIQLLETLKSDQATLDKINEYSESSITSNTIDNYIKDVEKNSASEDEKYEFTIFEENKNVNKLVLKTSEIEIQVEKKKEENALNYSISLAEPEEEDGTIAVISANYTGLSSMEEINENYKFELQQSNMMYKYNFNNKINFTNSVSIEELSDENAMILNKYPEEQVSNFLKQVEERIQNVNKEQMEELGIEENENPLLQILIPIIGNTINSQNMVQINDLSSDMKNIEVRTFNQKFENYESSNQRGTAVKGLLSTIQLNNESLEEGNQKIEEIHFDGEEYEVTDQNIAYLKSSVELETSYRVEFERDENTGYIYRVVINKE